MTDETGGSMTRTHMLFVLVMAAAALALAGCGGGSDNSASGTTETTTTETTTTDTTTTASGSTGTTLDGTVGPGFDISLKDSSGNDAKTLTAGTYTINVDDKSDIHNFHLTGPGVDESTDVSGTGTTTWTVTLQSGTYTFQCDPHASSMNGSFTVS
jgi:plastocyanin